MIESILINLKLMLVQYVLGGWISWAKVNIAWSFQHPIYGTFFWFALFGLSFAAYGCWRQGYESGGWSRLKMTQKACIAAILIPFALPCYFFDIFVMRVLVCGLVYQVKPWMQDGKFWSASWTFSRFVRLYEHRPGRQGDFARWWSPILHFLEPVGH